MTQTSKAHAAWPVAVSPTGRLHTYRPGQLRTVCGINLLYKAPPAALRKLSGLTRTRAERGWVRMRGDWQAYDALADDRTCANCRQGVELGTGPGE